MQPRFAPGTRPSEFDDNASTGSQRETLTAAEVAAYQSSGSLIVDDRRRRPFWFDGRFLAAKDLNQEQDYFLMRQSDLRRAAGWGVVSGLKVKQVTTTPQGLNTSDTVTITAGEGVTPEGELVSIPSDIEIELSDIADQQQLNATFGLSEIPTSPARSRSGLFVLALRPVEFTANPVASYPKTLSGQRSTQDGDTVEATAVVMVPYPDSGTLTEMAARRSRVAREIFLAQSSKAVASDVLPVAMIGMDHGLISWVDPWMVRREAGSDQLLLTMGSSGRATQRAYLLQYENQLQQVIANAPQGSAGFAATDYFNALPPIGRLPAASIDPGTLVQKYFPQDMDVTLSLIPQDEVPALIEQSLALPAIDLTRSSATLSVISVYVLMPVTRQVYATAHNTLGAPTLIPSVPVDPARRLPIDTLKMNKALQLSGSSLVYRLGSRVMLPNLMLTPPPATGSTSDASWQSIFNNQSFAWYVRRRSTPQSVTIGSGT